MKVYHAIVNKDEDSAYGVEFPDLPGCFSAADELTELQANACEAIAVYLDGETAPKPSPLKKIREGAAQDLAEGARCRIWRRLVGRCASTSRLIAAR